MLCSKGLGLSFLSGIPDHWERTICQLVLLITLLGLGAMLVYRWACATTATAATQELAASNEPKARLSVRESIRWIARSKYLIPLAIMVLGFNISINLTDVLWKEQLKRFFTDPNEMLAHMNTITMGIGILGTVGAAFFTLMVTRLGWTFTAIVTPATMLLLAVGFFTFLFCGDSLYALSSALFGLTPFAMTVYFGSVQNCASKACKYSVFDATKELAFLPLNPDAKLRGKAAIDGLGSGIGKSGSSLAYQGMIIGLGSVASSTPYIAVVLIGVLAAWTVSVIVLGRQFKEMTQPDIPKLPEESGVLQEGSS